MKYFKTLLACIAFVGLAACSGGGGNSGSTGGQTSTPAGTTPAATATAVVSNFIIALDKNSVKNDGLDQAKLFVTTLDATNNIVAGANVAVSTDSGSVYIPGGSVTDANGAYSGVIKAGVDKSNRVITASVTVNGVTKKVSFQLIGSKLTLTAIPVVTSPTAQGTLTVFLQDANGAPISGAPIVVSGAVLQASATTDLSGNAALSYVSPATPGSYTINVAGSGVTSASSILVSNGNSTIPPANLPVGVVPSFSISPNVLGANASGSSLNQAAMRFLAVDSSNQPIPNVRVRFEKAGIGLGYNGTISTGINTIYSDISGIALSAYVAGTESSPTNGVVFRACYKATDFSSATDCPNQITTTLTVSGQAVAISISDDLLLTKGVGTYSQKFAVSVVDSAGRGVANAPVSFSVETTHYGKGSYSLTPTYILSNGINVAIPNLTTSPNAFGFRVLCPNEDVNRSGILDPSEDTNANGRLDPSAADVSITADLPGVTTTDASGIVIVRVTWLQKVATWEVFRIRARTNVAGSEGLAESSFITSFVKGDDKEGAAFLLPPYGFGACNQGF